MLMGYHGYVKEWILACNNDIERLVDSAFRDIQCAPLCNYLAN